MLTDLFAHKIHGHVAYNTSTIHIFKKYKLFNIKKKKMYKNSK